MLCVSIQDCQIGNRRVMRQMTVAERRQAIRQAVPEVGKQASKPRATRAAWLAGSACLALFWGATCPDSCGARTAEKAKTKVEWSRNPLGKARARPWDVSAAPELRMRSVGVGREHDWEGPMTLAHEVLGCAVPRLMMGIQHARS